MAIDRDVARRFGLGAVGLLWLIALCTIIWWPWTGVSPPGTVQLVHWANGHIAGDPVLLNAFANRFNAVERRTAAGSLIIVKPFLVNSGQIERELISRIQGKGGIRRDLPNPTLVTPVAEHWLYDINDTANSAVVETGGAQSLASSWIGIATFKDMAECLGWPAKDIGYEDIVALSADPAGWESRNSCARSARGRQPRLAYTDPNTSSTGRTVLYTLLSIATGKPPETDPCRRRRRTCDRRSAQVPGPGGSLRTRHTPAQLRDFRRPGTTVIFSRWRRTTWSSCTKARSCKRTRRWSYSFRAISRSARASTTW